jgi:DNA-directed RNA polymerase subunit RPC12/RpoP
VGDKFKVFHFQELDWLLYFPFEGNKGKYCGYTVVLKERKKTNADNRVKLGDIVERRELEEHYPHTVGFFKGSGEEAVDCNPQYITLTSSGFF